MKKDSYLVLVAGGTHSTNEIGKMVEAFLGDVESLLLRLPEDLPKLLETCKVAIDHLPRKILIGASIDTWGMNYPLIMSLDRLLDEVPGFFEGTTAGLLLYSETALFTKSFASQLIFLLNSHGATIPGHPLVEAIPEYRNFRTWQKTLEMPLESICHLQCQKLRQRMDSFTLKKHERPRILALHASNETSSNTLALWNMVKENIDWADIHEVHVENGSVHDCKGCSFKACLHFGEQQQCFYGGSVVGEIYPEIEKAHGVVWISPNYNDAVSANLTAVINRLTALYRVTPFYTKQHYSIVVSGNSGSDSVIRQLMDALCINKGFSLPPHSYIHGIANDPGELLETEGIKKLAESFSQSMKSALFLPRKP